MLNHVAENIYTPAKLMLLGVDWNHRLSVRLCVHVSVCASVCVSMCRLSVCVQNTSLDLSELELFAKNKFSTVKMMGYEFVKRKHFEKYRKCCSLMLIYIGTKKL